VSPALKPIGSSLRADLAATTRVLLRVKRQARLLHSSAEDAVLWRTLMPRLPLVDPLNLLQAELMALLRKERIGEGTGAEVRHDRLLEDSFAVVTQAISAGMQNTG